MNDDGEWPLTADAGGYAIRAKLSNEDLSLDFEMRAADSVICPDPDIHGFLRWDGCCNWSTGESGYAHACGLDDFNGLRDAFDALYSLATDNMPAFEG